MYFNNITKVHANTRKTGVRYLRTKDNLCNFFFWKSNIFLKYKLIESLNATKITVSQS